MLLEPMYAADSRRTSIFSRWRLVLLTLCCFCLALPGWSQEGTELTATVFPFVDSNGRVYATNPDGFLELLELVEAVDVAGEPESSVAFERENPDAMSLLEDALQTDVYIGGSVFRLEDQPILAVTAAWSDTGEVVAQVEIALDPSNVPDVFWELPETPPEQELAIPVEALYEAYSAGGLRQQVLPFGPGEDVREQLSWLDKLIDTLGGALRGSGTRPAKFDLLGGGSGGEDEDGPAPGDGLPPNLFGEEMGANQLCRVKLQCKWSLATRYYSLSGGFIARAYHCGWYTFIETADPPRLGVHLQPSGLEASGLKGKVEALVFQGDTGFQELEPAYKFLPIDSQRDNLSDVCWKAACLRATAWDYSRMGPRQYRVFGQDRPNSNSFHGALRRVCVPFTADPPVYPEEGKYPGLHYWERMEKDHGKHWTSFEW